MQTLEAYNRLNSGYPLSLKPGGSTDCGRHITEVKYFLFLSYESKAAAPWSSGLCFTSDIHWEFGLNYTILRIVLDDFHETSGKKHKHLLILLPWPIFSIKSFSVKLLLIRILMSLSASTLTAPL